MFSSNTSAVSADAVFVEEVFQTHLYTGNGSTQTITNGIDVTGKGGLIWFKERASQGFSHALVDTARGNLSSTEGYSLASDTDSSQSSVRAVPTSSGFSLSGGSGVGPVNFNGSTYVSWTFRKQPKFFDVVTWSGNNIAGRQIPHSLGSVPGCIIVKNITSGTNWQVYHRSLGNTKFLELNTTAAEAVAPRWNDTTPTSTVFTVGSGPQVNSSPNDYVAYLFAHDAGGFGLTGTDNVISCGSFTTDGSGNATVSLGYEPQWVLIKQTDGVDSWYLNDNMRGMAVSGNQPNLSPNSSAAESAGGYNTYPNATGFTASVGIASKNYIYIAIRRGPMKTPTTGTSVYGAVARTGTGASATVTGLNFPPDLFFYNPNRSSSGYAVGWFDRLRGTTQRLSSNTGGGESNYGTDSVLSYNMNGVTLGVDSLATGINTSGVPTINWFLGRAPGFFDEVCYTGNGTYGATNHNLGVVPELVIYKKRSVGAEAWGALQWLSSISYRFGNLNLTNAFATYTNDPAVAGLFSSTQFCKYYDTSGQTYVAYLFASCPGVSKVGSYTGTGALQTINCGFTGGARFVLIKRTDSTGDWYVYDSTRGITSGNDPYLLMNSTAAEVTGTNYVDTTSVGFQVTAAAPAGLNANGGTYIFLAIA